MAETKKIPNPIDAHVGSRVRIRRTMLGLSQEKLGEGLGITFQQIQKYEKGANRIGASSLYMLSEILKVPVNFFYEDMPGLQKNALRGMSEADSPDYVVGFLSTPEGLQLNKAFANIKDPKVRKKVLDLVRSLADEDE